MNSIKVRAKLIELWTRVVGIDTNGDIYTNGSDNLYPNEIERAVGNSPTASRSARIMAKFIAGTGVIGENVTTNVKKNHKITDTIREMANSISVQNGIFLHIGYGLDTTTGKFIPKRLTTFDYVQCRIAQEDAEENNNKIWVADWEKLESKKSRISRTRKNNEKKKWYYPYNRNQDVIKAQIAEDSKGENLSPEEMISRYRGQVLYVNLTPNLKYALSKFDSVYNDCDTEFRMSLYSNTVIRGGFLGKTAVLTQGLDTETSKAIVDDVQKWLGAENAANVYHLDVERTDNLDNILKIIQVESQYNDDQFSNTDKRVRRNITGAANNIPEPLIYAGEGALFGTSGDAYRELKEFYNEQTEEERNIIEQVLNELGFNVKIKTFLDEETPAAPPAPEVPGEEENEEEPAIEQPRRIA